MLHMQVREYHRIIKTSQQSTSHLGGMFHDEVNVCFGIDRKYLAFFLENVLESKAGHLCLKNDGYLIDDSFDCAWRITDLVTCADVLVEDLFT